MRLYPDGLFVGGGVYMPDAQSMARLRAAIADDRTGAELDARLAAFRSTGGELTGATWIGAGSRSGSLRWTGSLRRGVGEAERDVAELDARVDARPDAPTQMQKMY